MQTKLGATVMALNRIIPLKQMFVYKCVHGFSGFGFKVLPSMLTAGFGSNRNLEGENIISVCDSEVLN